MIRLRRTRSVTDSDGLQLRSADAGTGGHHSDRMVARDAVTSGFVESLAHPRGNLNRVTCLTSELMPKRMALLRELLPSDAEVS